MNLNNTNCRTTPHANLIPGREDRPEAIAVRESASVLADLVGFATFNDCDSATIIYEKAHKARPSMTFEFLLGSVFFAGKVQGKREARAQARESQKSRP